MSQAKKLRSIIERKQAVLMPGAANALTAVLIEEAGFETAFFTGAGFANFEFGMPDVGLTTMTEVAEQVARTTEVIGIPLLVDADTGFGNAMNVRRTIREMERAGAAGIMLEDQLFPKRCGHFDGTDVIPAEEMVAKLKAALDARRNPDTVLVARTDARAKYGIEEAIRRAQLYAETGADVTFVEAPRTREELELIPKSIPAPQVVNIVEGGKTPELHLPELEEFGFRIVYYANAAMRGAIKGMQDVLAGLHRDGTTEQVLDRMASWRERQRIVRLPEHIEIEKRYAVS